jgi:hypothetical protein
LKRKIKALASLFPTRVGAELCCEERVVGVMRQLPQFLSDKEWRSLKVKSKKQTVMKQTQAWRIKPPSSDGIAAKQLAMTESVDVSSQVGADLLWDVSQDGTVTG